MKEPQKIKLNIIFKESRTPNEIAVNSLNSISSLSGQSMKRLFAEDDIDNNQIGSKKSKGLSKERQDIFNSTYADMSEAEQKLHRIWQIELEPGVDLDAIIEEIDSSSDVESVEVNELNELYLQPNDPRYQELYGLHKIQCECAWEQSEGEGIVVAVVDTGVDYTHPDIAANMWQDANGNYGKDFSDNDNNPLDYQGHGSHVAGTIAAVGNNKKGVIGVAPKVKIMAVKIFPNAYDDVAAKALKYAVDNGARVINNSWGPSRRRPKSPIIEAAVDYVYAKGGICVFAAGNSADETSYYSPANHPKTIAVAATDQNDKRARFSNFGKDTDIAAPGQAILSLQYASSNYNKMSGTSMSCPHVAGACALLLSKEPGLSFQEVKHRLVSSADRIQTDEPIGGRLNVCKILT